MAEKVKKPREVATADLIQQYEGKLALLKTWESLRAETQLRENDYIITLKSRLRNVRNYLLHRKDPIANIGTTNRVELTNGQRRGFRSANWKLFQFSNDLTSAANVVRADEKLTAFVSLIDVPRRPRRSNSY